MFTAETQVRVRYAETDKMGYVYYGNYAQYFEVGRVEALRELGLSYKTMEEDGVMLPVFTFDVQYFKPAYYDDLLTIKTSIVEIPKARITFEYETFNEKGELLNKAKTTLVFIDMLNNKPRQAPAYIIEKLKKYFPQ